MARDIVVIGGSAGALQPLMQMLGGLPDSLPAAIFVVVHTSPDTPGRLPTLLSNRTRLPVSYAEDRQEIRRSQIFIAPPNHHLLLNDGRMSVTRGPRENGFRPAVDPLFRTAATTHGARVIGVVLSGGLDDGTRGLAAIKRAGGLAVVQQLDEAFSTGMPASALRNVRVDHVVPASDLADLIVRLVGDGPIEKDLTMAAEQASPDRAARGLEALRDESFNGPPSAFTCPECGGALWELANGNLTRFACHVGHSYSPETMVSSMAASLEAALWTALRALEENGAFLRRMEERALAQGLQTIAEGYAARARDAESRAGVVRTALVDEVLPKSAATEAEASIPPPRPGEVS